MAGKFAKIKYSMNDSGDQVKTQGEHQPRPTLKYPKFSGDSNQDAQISKQLRRDSVPGIDPNKQFGNQGEQYAGPQQFTKDKQDGEQNDVDVVIKLSALRKLKAAAGHP